MKAKNMKKREALATQERVRLVATRCFAERGYRGTNVRMICELAHANLGAVNYHFGSKQELYGDVVRALVAGWADGMRDLHKQARDPHSWREAIRTWIRLYVEMLQSDQEPERWLSLICSHELADPTPTGGYLFADFFAPIIEELRRLLCLGLPPNAPFEQGQLFVVSVLGQCTLLAHRQPPWDRLIIPDGISKTEWLNAYSEQILHSVTAQLNFQPR